MYIEIERGERNRKREIESERDNLANIEMNREREREKENDYSIVVVAAAPIADVQSMALSLPDQLPVLLQRHPIASPSFWSRGFSDSSKSL